MSCTAEQLQDRAANESRLLWIACGNIIEEINQRNEI